MSEPTSASDPSVRPSRAELRRAREAAELRTAEHRADGAATASVPVGERRSRADLRAEREVREKKPHPLVVLLSTWWAYPLAALVVVAVVLGMQSASTPRPSDTPVVIQTLPPPSP